MATHFTVPSSPVRNRIMVDTFLGADFTNSPLNVDEKQSPNCPNMIRDVPGKVRKCMGYHTIETYEGKINGFHRIHGSANGLVHAGTKMYFNGNVVYTDANNARSKSWQFENKVYIADGKALLIFDGSTVKKVSEVAKIPTTTIAKSPSGGGTSYENLNLLQPGFTEMFLGTASDTQYHLSFGTLDSKAVEVSVLNASGNWVKKTENVDFTVDRTNGIVNFTTALGVSPVTGEDNVKITAYRTVSGYADRINKCCIGIQYGISGARDRLFLSGNPDFVNQDWYSDQYDPTYFPDTNYGVLGDGRSAIMGYTVINNYLAAHKDEMEPDQNIILREGTLIDNAPAFRTVNAIQGAGAVSKWSFAYLCNEPLFLTRLGIYAITAQDVTGEKYGQNRSFYLNGKLLKEDELENAFAFVHKDLYWLCINDVAYILDGLQPLQTDKSMPYATRQYAGFYRTNLPANCMWEEAGELYFGTYDGKICKFYTDSESPSSYNDDGAAIDAIWETPDFDGKVFYKNKSFRYLAIRVKTAIKLSISISALKRGLWVKVKDNLVSANYLSFSNLTFSRMSFSCDTTQKTVPMKLRLKKLDKVRFRIENDKKNEPLGLYDLALEYVENGNTK